MVRFKYLLPALLAAMLVGCAGSDDGPTGPVTSGTSGTTADGRAPVGFAAYLSRSVTRAGVGGILTSDGTGSTVSLQEQGFGVFAYYTDLKKYDQTYVPNFMYNTHVTYSGVTNTWGYTPVMYWPNEYGSNAQSDDEDKVTFFAYAPYAAHESAAAGSVTGDATVGITGFSRNTTVGDPIVKYIASFDPAESVDLCWGVVGTTETSWNRIQGTAQTMTAGKPWVDVEHPQGVTDQKLKFTFKHALSQLNVQIDADVDATAHSDGGTALDASTRIYVRSISFTGIALQGALNLNNQKADEALWLDYSGTTDLPYGQSVTIHDGRRDGREGAENAAADNETPSGLNSAIVQNNAFTGGVTTTLQNAFGDGSSLTTPVCVIPTGEAMTVTIVYDVETLNPNLPGYISDGLRHGVSIENKITKTVGFDGGLKCGKKYTLKLHLGMNSVKFDASVDAWQEGTEASGWLPANGALTLSLGSASTMSLGGGSQSLTATTTAPTVSWSTSDDTVVDISTSAGTRGDAGTRAVKTLNDVGNKTVYLIPRAAGTATITCTDSAGNTASVTITVTDSSPSYSVSLDKSEITLAYTATETLTATPSAGASVTGWTSSDETVATVSNGVVTALSKTGDATITCTVTGGATATCTVHVVASVKPKATTATVAAATGLTYGDTGSLVDVTGSAANGTMHYAVTTTSSAPEAGEYSTAVPAATSRNAGTYYVWYKAVATDAENYSDSDVASVSVTIAKADVSISYAQIVVNKLTNDVDFTNALTNAGGHSVTYSSNNTGVATVNVSSGLVHLVAAGTTTITASVAETANYKSASATYTLNVTNTPTPQASPTVSGWTNTETIGSGVSGTKL